MKLWGRISRRPFVSSRPSYLSKSSKAELNFKENNEVNNPFDVIDRNISGIEHRLRLYELRRLKEQLFLDKSDLNYFKLVNLPDVSHSNKSSNVNFEISYLATSLFPGVNCSTENSRDSNVTICLKFEWAELSQTEIHKIKRILNLSDHASEFTLTISDFPFVSQNKIRAIEIVKAIVALAKNDKCSEKDINSLLFNQTISFSNPLLKSSDQKRIPEFPQEWLKIPKQKERTE